MIKTLSGTLTGNPSFTGGKVKCISEIELWVNRYQLIKGKQTICYQPQGGAVSCIEGDDYKISEVMGDCQPYSVWLYFKIVNVAGAILQEETMQIEGFSPYSYDFNLFGAYYYLRWYDKNDSCLFRMRFPSSFFSSFSGARLESISISPIVNPIQYKIEIFKGGDKIAEFISPNPISAWSETSSDKCVEEGWKKESSWVQLPFDNLKVRKLGEVYWFWLQRGLLTSPVAIIRKKDDCKMPLYKLIVKPKWGKCKEKPEKKCPSGTVESFEHNGFLCCYNKEGNLIKSIKL